MSMRSDLKAWEARWLFKIRGEMVYLNGRSWGFESRVPPECSLCNSGEAEDVFHFLASCSMLADYRLKWTGKKKMNRQEVVQLLIDYPRPLLRFAREAWPYRRELVTQFNYL